MSAITESQLTENVVGVAWEYLYLLHVKYSISNINYFQYCS